MMVCARFRYSMPRKCRAERCRRTDFQYSVESKYFRRYSHHFCTVHYAVPHYFCSFIGYNGTGVWAEILKGLNSGYWCKPSQPIYSLGLLLYIVLIVFFAYFYTSITFNPLMIADNMKSRVVSSPVSDLVSLPVII